jgi:hypothetical protein
VTARQARTDLVQELLALIVAAVGAVPVELAARTNRLLEARRGSSTPETAAVS